MGEMSLIKQIQAFCGDEQLFENVNTELDGNDIYITAEEVSFVKITWEANFSKTSVVLGDAWERSYGDLCFKPISNVCHMPWYFAVSSEDGAFYCGVKTLPNAFCSWNVTENEITLELDLRCGGKPVRLSGRKLFAASVVKMSSEKYSFEQMKKFCGMMCDNPMLPVKPLYGGNDWYCCYGDNSERTVLLQTERISECSNSKENRPFMVIDDGWQRLHNGQVLELGGYNGGPWDACNGKFSSMAETARKIKELNVRPGIWYRPLITMESFDDAMYIKRDGGLKVIDPSVDFVINKVKEDVSRIREWGFELIKHDFTTYDLFGKWGFQMAPYIAEGDWSFADRTRTSAEIVKALYAAIKEAAGDMLIIGCNTVSHLCAGLAHMQRTGDDTSGIDFNRTLKNGVNTLAFRGAQHEKFYAVDADCVGITDKIPWKQNDEWLRLIAQSGTALFVSIDENAYNSEIKAALTKAFDIAAKGTQGLSPIGACTEVTPNVWVDAQGNKVQFNWN